MMHQEKSVQCLREKIIVLDMSHQPGKVELSQSWLELPTKDDDTKSSHHGQVETVENRPQNYLLTCSYDSVKWVPVACRRVSIMPA